MRLFTKKHSTEEPVEENAQVVESTQAEPAVPTASGSRRVPLTHRTAAKVIAFFLVIVMAVVTVVSGIGVIVMIEGEFYTTPEWSYQTAARESLAENDVQTLIHYLSKDDLDEGNEIAVHYLSELNVASVEMTFSEGPRNNWSYDSGAEAGSWEYSATLYHMKNTVGGDDWYSLFNDFGEYTEEVGTVEATLRLSDELIQQDKYFFADRLISMAYALRYWIYAIGGGTLVVALACFIFLMCASGRKNGLQTAQPGWGTRVPLDLLTGAVLFAALLLIQLMAETGYFQSPLKQVLVLSGCGILLMIMALGWCMSFATRVKIGHWWKNTIIYLGLKIAWRLLKWLCSGLRRMLQGLISLLRQIPLVWKTALGLVVLTVAELLAILICEYNVGALLLLCFFKNLLVGACVLFVALTLRKLQKGGEALAAGDLAYQVDTDRMFWDFKRHGENLNSIGEGMTAAVEQRLKSERMKTELITNVSHDIKTPLTSIINYSDLIEKESCDNPTITEYAGVLHRQSERLKRLIEDLVEASKASTGNLEILLAPCEVGVMLTQAAGEYEQKLQERELELITKQPETPVKIMADGRRLWRVFDNLMNNVCKYAQRGTRVYLTLEEQGGQAVISFKNISREPLNLSADELMERFVQGDTSRKSEGNGLGLSIAKSLTELQNGTMELTTDGDLFKAVLRFPTIS